jgi:hypothetical protein
MALSQFCGKVILNVSFFDKHDDSSFCRLRERCSSGAKHAKLEARKVGPDLSIRSPVVGRLKVFRQDARQIVMAYASRKVTELSCVNVVITFELQQMCSRQA